MNRFFITPTWEISKGHTHYLSHFDLQLISPEPVLEDGNIIELRIPPIGNMICNMVTLLLLNKFELLPRDHNNIDIEIVKEKCVSLIVRTLENAYIYREQDTEETLYIYLERIEIDNGTSSYVLAEENLKMVGLVHLKKCD